MSRPVLSTTPLDRIAELERRVATLERRPVTQADLYVFNIGAALVGSPPALGSVPFKFQGGTVVLTTDPSGFGTIVFPTPFPAGLLTAIAVPGSSGGGNWTLVVNDGGFSKSQFQIKASLVNALIRINWLAVGW